MEKALLFVIASVIGIGLVAIVALIMAVPFQWLWNDAAVPVLGLRTITFWQALELQILAGLIFGRTGASSK